PPRGRRSRSVPCKHGPGSHRQSGSTGMIRGVWLTRRRHRCTSDDHAWPAGRTGAAPTGKAVMTGTGTRDRLRGVRTELDADAAGLVRGADGRWRWQAHDTADDQAGEAAEANRLA